MAFCYSEAFHLLGFSSLNRASLESASDMSIALSSLFETLLTFWLCRLGIDFPLNSGATYQLTLDPLFAAVNPEKCIVRVLPAKVEIILAKATAGQKWASLEGSELAEKDVTMKESSSESDAVKRAVFSDLAAGAPAYPTSSKKGPKNWDKITADEDETESGGDPNDFFKKIFKDASPDMQRAMTKSYLESNGTSLSTNWDEVGKGKVETLPPDGMEAKSWNS